MRKQGLVKRRWTADPRAIYRVMGGLQMHSAYSGVAA